MKNKFFKAAAAIVSALVLTAGLASGASAVIAEEKSEEKNPVVAIEIEDYGTITVELDPEAAPITVENFLKLVNVGFYDGLTFHRIISGFMIQGGDPLGNGTGGSEETIKGEFASNGVENPWRNATNFPFTQAWT